PRSRSSPASASAWTARATAIPTSRAVDTYLAVASKRDWRSYADRPVPDDVVERILEAGRVAGSAMNRQPWSFVVVDGDERRAALAEAVYAAGNVNGAA